MDSHDRRALAAAFLRRRESAGDIGSFHIRFGVFSSDRGHTRFTALIALGHRQQIDSWRRGRVLRLALPSCLLSIRSGLAISTALALFLAATAGSSGEEVEDTVFDGALHVVLALGVDIRTAGRLSEESLGSCPGQSPRVVVSLSKHPVLRDLINRACE